MCGIKRHHVLHNSVVYVKLCFPEFDCQFVHHSIIHYLVYIGHGSIPTCSSKELLQSALTSIHVLEVTIYVKRSAWIFFPSLQQEPLYIYLILSMLEEVRRVYLFHFTKVLYVVASVTNVVLLYVNVKLLRLSL